MPPNPLRNIEITQYYQNKTRFIGIFSRDNFLRDEYKDSVIKYSLDSIILS